MQDARKLTSEMKYLAGEIGTNGELMTGKEPDARSQLLSASCVNQDSLCFSYAWFFSRHLPLVI